MGNKDKQQNIFEIFSTLLEKSKDITNLIQTGEGFGLNEEQKAAFLKQMEEHKTKDANFKDALDKINSFRQQSYSTKK